MSSRWAFPVPITFPNHAETKLLVEKSFTEAKITAVAQWEHSSGTVMVVGAVDGSVFIFRGGDDLKLHPEGPASPLRLSSNSTSRSSSRSSFSLPFSITGRSSIVSGVTTDAVEAPKNFVDYDNEPEKLKDMLKGKIIKDGHNDDHRKLAPPQSPSKHRSLVSTANFPVYAPSSVSSPPTRSPSASHAHPPDSRLICHLALPYSGSAHSVVDIQSLGSGLLVAILQKSGHLVIIDPLDGKYVTSVSLETKKQWSWRGVNSYQIGEVSVLLVSASLDDAYHDQTIDNCCASLFILHCTEDLGVEARLENIAFFNFQGLPDSIGIFQNTATECSLYHVSSDGHFLTRGITILPPPLGQQPLKPAHTLNFKSLAAISLSNPFKSSERVPSPTLQEQSRVELGMEEDCGVLTLGTDWTCNIRSFGHVLYGVAWSTEDIMTFRYHNNALTTIFPIPKSGVAQCQWIASDVIAVGLQDTVQLYGLKTVDANNDNISVSLSSTVVNMQPELLNELNVGVYESISFSTCDLLVVRVGADGHRGIWNWLRGDNLLSKYKSRNIWRASISSTSRSNGLQPTVISPLDMNTVVIGFDDGRIRQTSFTSMFQESSRIYVKTSDTPLDGYITALEAIVNARTKEQFLVGGADDGSIAFWNANLKLCARWVIFTEPIARVIHIDDKQKTPLHGCVLCVSGDGTIAVVAVDDLQFLYVVPGSASPLRSMYVSDNSLLLLYSGSQARLWDVKTKEFWRSTTEEKALEMVSQGEWNEELLESSSISDNTLQRLPGNSCALDSASTILLDLGHFISESTLAIKAISTNRAQTQAIFNIMELLKTLLSAFLTPGLNVDIDEICREKLEIPPTSAFIGFSNIEATSMFHSTRSQDAWCVSENVSAARALVITVALRALGLFSAFSEASTTVSTFYSTSLVGPVGPSFKPPSLTFLALRWFDSSVEFRHAAKVLFDATVVRLTDDETFAIIERWRHYLPCLQSAAEREMTTPALALFLCGYIATEKYSLLPTSALTDISKSIALYLNEGQSMQRILAVDLCSRGFHIWQIYIDSMEVLRSLFSLATSSRKDQITAQNINAQTRLAVLQISVSNTTLFMTALTLDILEPSTVEQRKSVMQILAYLIKKRPLVLYPNLPKLMEAVVKSLDPNSTSARDAVFDTVTEILGHVIKTFPSVDFHMSSQRLAVGTSEGAVLMYDLKTATRLYVLEGHKKSITACTFSPDGRRLVTLSLEESVALVWKVGISFSSFFNPGAPPRQGHGGSQPFKTLSFNVGENATMDVAESLELVHFEWPTDRSVRLKIRDSTLTFST